MLVSDGHPLPLRASVRTEERAVFLDDVSAALLTDAEELAGIARFGLFRNHRQEHGE